MRLTLDRLVGLDLLERHAITERGATIPFDTVSLGTGSSIAVGAIEGAERFARLLRPTHEFVAAWTALAPRLAEADRPKITVVGAGAGGLEVPLAIAHAMKRACNGALVQVVTGGAYRPFSPRLVSWDNVASIKLVKHETLAVAWGKSSYAAQPNLDAIHVALRTLEGYPRSPWRMLSRLVAGIDAVFRQFQFSSIFLRVQTARPSPRALPTFGVMRLKPAPYAAGPDVKALRSAHDHTLALVLGGRGRL